MSQPIISVRGVSKRYVLGETIRHDTLRDRLADSFKRILSPSAKAKDAPAKDANEFWALNDVSFDVQQGDVVGIIGRNGAGKSTLLKILSQITEPTRGEIRVRGRIASLLEVGTGFHPELTGRENVYLNGAILGMSQAEIKKKFDEIVAFAEIEKFLDTPVKRYSSGMYVRLAFAVAAHLEPEILIVDEVLAVGDMQFQKKCLGKMGDISKSGGRTVLFVSHNMTAVKSLCKRAVWLNGGALQSDGPADQVVDAYQKKAAFKNTFCRWDTPEIAPGHETAKVKLASIEPLEPNQGDLTVRTSLRVTFEYWILKDGLLFNPSVHLFDTEGNRIFNTFPTAATAYHGQSFAAGLYRSEFIIPGDLLNSGTYSLQLMLVENQNRVLACLDDILAFEVSDAPDFRGAWHGTWQGAVRPILKWETRTL